MRGRGARGRGHLGRGHESGSARGRGGSRGFGQEGTGRPKPQLDSSVSLPDVLRRERPFSYEAGQKRWDMSNFVKGISGASHIDEVVLSLSKESNLRKIDQILQLKCEVAGLSTFELVLLPFMEFLTSEKFKQSTHGTIKKTIYRHVVNEPLFLTRIMKCFVLEHELLESKRLYDKCVATCIDLLYQICIKIPNVIAEDHLVYDVASDLFKLIASDEVAQLTVLNLLEQTLEICEEFLPDHVIRPREGRAAPVDQYRVQPQTIYRVSRGHQRQTEHEEPRHDNDDPNYTRVYILPTHAEICCLEEPRLPLYPESNAPLDTLFDFHFRLIREDMLAQFRRAIQWFLGGVGLDQFNYQQRLQPPRHDNIPNLLVCNRVELVKLACHSRKGVYFVIRCAQPYANMRSGASSGKADEKAKASARKEFWGRSDRLSVGSLVALAFGVTKKIPSTAAVDNEIAVYPRSKLLRATNVFYGTVAARNEWDLSGDPKSLTTYLKFSSRDAQLVFGLLRRQQTCQPDKDTFLIEASGVCFPPTRAILETLQTYDVLQPPPLLELLFAEGNDAVYTTHPKEVSNEENLGVASILAWNLQHLVKDELKSDFGVVDIRSVPITSFESLCTLLNALEQQGLLKLDGSQVEAFAAAMTRACCLIQGPPGTGKSYVGIKIVETFLKNKKYSAVSSNNQTPILCVCYTNHALDQFLEELVASGACELNKIVRIGGSSKSKMLQTRNIMNLKTDNSFGEHHTFSRLYRQCKIQEEEIVSAFNEKKSNGNFLSWLSSHYTREYSAIVGFFGDEEEDGDSDGFVTQDSRGKSAPERWNSWITGKKSPVFGTRGAGEPDVEAPAGDANVTPYDLLNTKDLWSLSKKKRKLLKTFWQGQWLNHSEEIFARQMQDYEDCVQEMREINLSCSLRILRSCKIVGMTTTGCAQNQELVRALSPNIVICEEAGEVLEAHLLPCITSGIQRLIQIGDHLQLRPSVTEFKLSLSARRGYNLDISLFERLVRDREAFYHGNLDVMRDRGILVTLQTQRRMRPEIADLVRFTLYDKLQDSDAVHAYPNLKGFRDNVWFFDHDHLETSDESSKSNRFEAETIVELVSYAVKQGYPGPEIAVLTPYLGQLRLIRRLLGSKSVRAVLEDKDAEDLARLEELDGEIEIKEDNSKKDCNVSMEQVVRLSTVDNFQGNEATVVFISTVRCNEEGNSGFLKISNRMNVMLSRAKHGMIIFGSSRTMRKEGKAKMFLNILGLLDERQMVGNGEIVLKCQNHGYSTIVKSAKDIRNLTPDGGCMEKCRARLVCGHACPKMCHVDDLQHEWTQCLEPCDRQINSCGHFCKRRCFEKCICDYVYPVRELSCGHKLSNITCTNWQIAMLRDCTRPTKVSMPVCNHASELPCIPAQLVLKSGLSAVSSDITIAYKCQHQCGGIRVDCGHVCTRNCGDCLQATGCHSAGELLGVVKGSKQIHMGNCTHPCDRVMACGHYCNGVCHPAGQCPPCNQACANSCSHSTCPQKCHEPCASCSEACEWHCRHTNTTCPLPCGSPCIKLPCNKRCDKTLSICGHQCPGLCGEKCLSSNYCRECGPQVSRYNDIVDLIMHGTLGDHDPNDSPLIMLGCGHALTVETLDGMLELSKFYASDLQEDDTIFWTDVMPLEPNAVDGDWASKYKCPHCRFLVVGGINRYGRVLKYAQARSAELKFLQRVRAWVQASRETRSLIQRFLIAQDAGGSDDEDIKNIRKMVRDLFKVWNKRVQQKSPTEVLMIKELSRLNRLQLEATTLNLAAYRQVVLKQSLIQVRLELLQAFGLWMHVLAETDESVDETISKSKETSLVSVQVMYAAVIKHESKLLQLCNESRSQQSARNTLVAGVRLRSYYFLAIRNHPQRMSALGDDSLEENMKIVKDELQRMFTSLKHSRDCQLEEVRALELLVTKCLRPSVFYQKMTIEEKRSVQQAMNYTDTNTGAFGGYGGHWYQCPNGHPYVIADCGGAMEQSKCPECHATIGGGSHRVVDGNTGAHSYFQ